ncbi:hypothetical protein [Streptomyces sp. GESEQ-4]|uniref:aromatic-ring hydroxylase C-terminal domain-containing protein n=1 Tax=Streptomyces sp. GESEQ-4 TaxID=2812655 RepID=UPI001B3327B6|nr:hypothetical protein [Streptomyces sp. GESEQ-4]
MRPDPQTRALWEMFSDLTDLDDDQLTLERPGPDVVTAVTRSADLLRERRGLLLDLVDRAEARDAAAAWTGRVNTVTARTDRVDLDATTLVRALGTWFAQ